MLRLIFIFLFPFSLSAQLKRFQFSEIKMGAPFNLIFYHTDSSEGVLIAKECFSIVDSLNDIFSDYSINSEVGQLRQLKPLQRQKISDELFAMIQQSKQAWEKSNKTFDITIGSLTKLWRQIKIEKRFPSEVEIKKAKQSCGFENMAIDIFSKTISFKKAGMQLDFGGIVKGYAAQKVIDYLKSKDITSALADAGGDIAMSDAPPKKAGWSIGINLPENEIELWNKNL